MLRHGPCWLRRGTALHIRLKIIFPNILISARSVTLNELIRGRWARVSILHNVVVIMDVMELFWFHLKLETKLHQYFNPHSSVVLRVKSLGVRIASMCCPAPPHRTAVTWLVKIEGVREPEDSRADTSQQIWNTINTAALPHTWRCVVLISCHLQWRVPHMGPFTTCQHRFIRSGNCACVHHTHHQSLVSRAHISEHSWLILKGCGSTGPKNYSQPDLILSELLP